MRYMLLIYGEEPTAPPSHEEIDAVMGEWWAYDNAVKDSGVHIAADALQPSQTATTVLRSTGQRGARAPSPGRWRSGRSWSSTVLSGTVTGARAADTVEAVFHEEWGPLLATSGELRRHHLLHSARAHFLARLGRHVEAAQAYREALTDVTNEAERAFLQRRLADVKASRVVERADDKPGH